MSAISSLASVIGLSDTSQPVTAAIGILDPKTGLTLQGSMQAFQYFPERITDSKAPEWAKKGVPGGSHPILSFINGGERTISFDAVFTQDDNPEPIGVGGLLTGAFSVGLGDLLGNKRRDTVDVAKAIGFLRLFQMPLYKNQVAEAPPFAVVYLPNSGIIGYPNIADSFVGAMINNEVVYESFHRNGAPRIVIISLTFTEVCQTGKNWKFWGSDQFKFTNWSNGVDSQFMYTKEVVGADSNNFSGGILGALGGAGF